MKVPGYGSRYLEDPSARLMALLSRDCSSKMGFFKFLTGRASGYFFMISRTRLIAGRPIFLKRRLSMPYIYHPPCGNCSDPGGPTLDPLVILAGAPTGPISLLGTYPCATL